MRQRIPVNQRILNKILVVDDEAAILKLLSSILGRKGVCVDTAVNGRDGLKKVRARPYDAIITDMKMPGLSGGDLLAEIRKARGESVPVIGMSGTPWMLDRVDFDAVLVKPFSQKNLFDVLDTVGAVVSGSPSYAFPHHSRSQDS